MAKEKETKTYKEAVERLDEILEKLQNSEVDIDELCSVVEEANGLLKVCKDKLTKTNATMEKLMKDMDDNK